MNEIRSASVAGCGRLLSEDLQDGQTIDGVLRSYDEGLSHAPQALINSNGYLEIFIREGHAAAHLKVHRGEPVHLV